MIRTFIYGSCVSRDTFERLPTDGFELLQYVARQSLISATAPPSSRLAPDIDTSSAFQRRMLEGDWNGSLLPLLREHADSIDLLLWDLCDERLGLRRLDLAAPPRRYAMATRSVDGIRAGVDEQLQDSPLVPFGSRKHRVLFLRALWAFADELRALGLLDKTLVVAPAWAIHTSTGAPTPSSFGLTPTRANRLYDDYYAAVRYVTNATLVTLPPGQVAADEDHLWGVAPFHYTESVYERLTEAILRQAGSCEAPAAPEPSAKASAPSPIDIHRFRPDGTAQRTGDAEPVTLEQLPTPEAQYVRTRGASGDPPDEVCVHHPEGHVFGRSGWGAFERDFDQETFYAVLGDNSHGSANHQDASSVTYTSRGTHWLVDPGPRCDPLREHLASRSAHNRLEILDRQEKADGQVRFVHVVSSTEADVVHVEDETYDGVAITRRVVFHRGGEFLVIVDHVRSPARIKAAQRWQLGPQVRADQDEDGFTLSGPHGAARIIWAGVQPFLHLHRGEHEPARGWVVEDGKDRPTPAAQIWAVRGGTEFRYVTVVGQADRGVLRVKRSHGSASGNALVVQVGKQEYPITIGRDGVELTYVPPRTGSRTPRLDILDQLTSSGSRRPWEGAYTAAQAVQHARQTIVDDGRHETRQVMAGGLARILKGDAAGDEDSVRSALIDVVGTTMRPTGWDPALVLPHRLPALPTRDKPVAVKAYPRPIHLHDRALELLRRGELAFGAQVCGDLLVPWVGRAGEGDTLVVRLHGAINRARTRVPFLAGLTSSQQSPQSFLLIQDPSLDRSRALTLGWYLGSPNTDGRSAVSTLIEQTREAVGATSVLLVGGSGGGFAALHLAARIPQSHALAFNPQTDLRRYIPRVVESALDACRGLAQDDDGSLNDVSVSDYWSSLPALSVSAHIISNIGDSHDERHVAPLEERADSLPGAHLTVERVDWGPGHKAPSSAQFLQAIGERLS
ncbi:DUF6270 domain-containing protein [uncultured Serinicoccus sp.]|uniref:DUF6270 domain-containing protein n=1 Tax=uncultured Serinicoccus sp. TaxID=735514 RepID=UPI0026369E74|nr:DUF6270 domain-containing protein [uncultured Serinicoccus sp.]